jgi:hypothetical protein
MQTTTAAVLPRVSLPLIYASCSVHLVAVLGGSLVVPCPCDLVLDCLAPELEREQRGGLEDGERLLGTRD